MSLTKYWAYAINVVSHNRPLNAIAPGHARGLLLLLIGGLVAACATSAAASDVLIDTPLAGPLEYSQDAVTIVTGGSVSNTTDFDLAALFLGNGSQLNLLGGTVLSTGQSTPAVLSGGADMDIQSGLIQTDGESSNAIWTDINGGDIGISGGEIVTNGRLSTAVVISGDAVVDFSAGTVTTAGNESTTFLLSVGTLNISGGVIDVTGQTSRGVWALGNSEVSMTGGSITNTGNSSHASTFSPPTSGIVAGNTATVLFAGGQITTGNFGVGIEAKSDSRVTITGGQIESGEDSFDLFSGHNAVIEIVGLPGTFEVNGIPVDFAGSSTIDIDEILNDFVGPAAQVGTVVGQFADGESFSFTFGNAAAIDPLGSTDNSLTTGTIRLVSIPEPATGALVFAVALIAAASRQKSRR